MSPEYQYIQVFDLVNEKFQLRKTYLKDDPAPVGIFNDLVINTTLVFSQ